MTRIRGATAAESETRHKSPYAPPRAPIYDLPDDYADDDRAPGTGGLFTLLTGVAIGILLGLAFGELWSLVTP